METPQCIKKAQTLVKEKNKAHLKKTVWEYNTGQFEKVDIAKTSISGRYPESGWASNDVCTMLYYFLSGAASLTLENGTQFLLKPEDVFLLPPKTWYAIEGTFEALMICAPAWFADQSLNRE